jgi:hypothetical protein
MEPTDVKGPLVQFQAAQFSKEEMKRVVKMMNGELAEAALPPDVLDNVFEMWWPKLEEDVRKELEGSDGDDDEARRSERDLLEEVLALTRRLASDRERRIESDHPVWDDILMGVAELVRVTRAQTQDEGTARAIRRIMAPLRYIARRDVPRGRGRSALQARHILMELEGLLESDLKTKPGTEPIVDESTA